MRFKIFLWIPVSGGNLFPTATLAVNVLGSFLIGFFSELLQLTPLSENYRFFIVIGFLGALTTFSTYAFDIVRLLMEQEYRLAFFYFFLSNLTTVILVAGGLFTVRLLFR